jgi:DNA-binding NtrC family response regulator
MIQQGDRAPFSLGSTTLLVVDDERPVRDACEAIAKTLGMATISAASANEGLAALNRTPIDIVLTDLRMPGMNGLEFLEALRKANPDVYVVVMSGYGSIESAVEAMKRGAFDFLTKPFRLNELREMLGRIEGQIALNGKAGHLRDELANLGGFSLLIGRSPQMQQAYRVVMRATASSNPVLLLGESGTGKELLARAIHLATKANLLPFIAVDCCSLMPELLESELFGHLKGAFPGAATHKPGLLASAECGTVFLNEVADLSIEAQTKLVRAIQEKAVRPYGSTKTVPMRARIIAASSRDLAKAVATGKFRQDLYYRLSILVVRLPAVRERRDDIPLLVEHFLHKLANEHGAKKTISSDALLALTSLDWPGNVAELETVLERAYTMSAGTTIGLCDLPQEIATKPLSQPAEDASGNLRLSEIERVSVLRAIEDSGGDKKKAARLLGISRTTLYRKLNEYKLSS